jgi:uncharacterized protein
VSQRPWTTAVAIFAKTPGLTPAKTRLAAGVGPVIAESFYLRALEITREVACAAAAADPGLTPYWAVAEQAGIGRECWSGLPQLWQGDGDLGARLAQVYDSLLLRHDAVLLIGSDSPLLVPGHLLQAHARLRDNDGEFVMGRALDGGFYLFGGKLPLARTIWTTVSYSGTDTADRLLANLQAIPALAAASTDLLPAQRALGEWIRTLALP